MRIAHLTDPHLTTLDGVPPRALLGKRGFGYLSWWRRRRHEHRPETLSALTAHLAADTPDLVFVTGDLVHVGLEDEIRAARAWLERLAAFTRVVLVPGNHDCYRRDSQAHVHATWAEFLHARPNDPSGFPTVLRAGDVSVIGLCSARAMPLWSAQGTLGTAQIARLARVLDESRGTFRCVGLHHPPLAACVSRRKALTDAPALRALLARYGVELVLHGHVHRNIADALGARTRVFATASASRSAGPDRASYRLFDIDADGAGARVGTCLKTIERDGTIAIADAAQWHTESTQRPA